MRKKIFPYITELIGKTPLVSLERFVDDPDFRKKSPNQGSEDQTETHPAHIVAKLEYLNPGGSIKDRIVQNMISDAEKRGFLKPGYTIIEPTSGNTGISLAMICAARGYKCILTMPDTTPPDIIRVFKVYGAEVLTTPGRDGMMGAIKKAEELIGNQKHMFMPQQFNNLSNPEIHEKTTAVEIWEDTGGKVDSVVAGVGTGGTITGLALGLRKKKKEIRIIAVEPTLSPVISGGKAGKHTIHGIGAGFIPRLLKKELLDEIVLVTDQDAAVTAGRILKTTGIPAGISSGAAAWAALKISRRPENRGKLIVVIFPDNSEKYINMGLLK